MVMRRSFVLSWVAAGLVLAGATTSVRGQESAPAPLLDVSASGGALSDGLITSIDGLELQPGETIIDGPPEIRQHIHAQQTAHAHSTAAACSPACYVPCKPGYYVTAEALLMQLDGGDGFTRAPGYAFDDYDFELAPRITIGRRFDCVDGYEFVYTGQLEWNDRVNFAGAGTFFQLPATFMPEAIALFNIAGPPTPITDLQFQQREARYNSIEFNRTYTGWDVVRMMLGIRSILYNEEYALGAVDTGVNPNQTALLTQDVDNFLIGPQIGLQMFYPLSKRVYTDTTIKGGVYLNFVDSGTSFVSSTGVAPNPTGVLSFIRGSSDETELAGMIEVGSRIGFNLTDSLSATVGYEIWYLSGVAQSSSQLPLAITTTSFNTLSADDDLFIHGLSVGAQFVY